MKIIFKVIFCILLITGYGYTNEIKVFDFTEIELSQLEILVVHPPNLQLLYWQAP